MEVRRQWKNPSAKVVLNGLCLVFVLFGEPGEPSHLVHQIRPGENAPGRAGIHGGGGYGDTGGDGGRPQGGASRRDGPSAGQRSDT